MRGTIKATSVRLESKMRCGYLALSLCLIACSSPASVLTDAGVQVEIDAATPVDANEGPQEIRLMSFNVMWEENGERAGDLSLLPWETRKELVNAFLLDQEPDVIGFQEASLEQQGTLALDLPHYSILYDETNQNTNPIFYRTSRFAIVEWGNFVLNDVPEQPDTNIGVRSTTWAILRDVNTDRAVVIYNLHLDHRSDGSSRQISVVRMTEQIETQPYPAVVIGDFNCATSSPTMQYLYGNVPLTNDLLENVTNQTPFLDGIGGIDHILLEGANWRSGPTLHMESGDASDHYAVSTILRL